MRKFELRYRRNLIKLVLAELYSADTVMIEDIARVLGIEFSKLEDNYSVEYEKMILIWVSLRTWLRIEMVKD